MTDNNNTNTRYFFFSGKGGVGKTSMASATAVYYAQQGKNTLIVTTDPAANLGDVFEQDIGHKVTQINKVEKLFAMEIDVESSTAEYKERTLAPMRAVFPEAVVAVMEEELNSPCTEEMAAFDKFVDFMESGEYEVVIFDTAPTGHTIRLLELPVDWSKHITVSEQGSGQTCMGPVQALKDSKAKFDRAVSILQNPDKTTFIFVVQPEATPIVETQRSIKELAKIGIKSNMLIVNGILPPEECENPFFAKRSEMQQRYLADIDAKLDMPNRKIYLLDTEIKGVAFLQMIGKAIWEQASLDVTPTIDQENDIQSLEITDMVNKDISKELYPSNGKSRSIFFAGKGGVGKTSISCITAVWLAKQKVKTLLVTTDPASHLSEIFEQEVDHDIVKISYLDNLHAVKIDPKKAAEAYKENIIVAAKNNYSHEVVEVMKEQLDSPCTEEMAVFHKFLDYAALNDYQVVVFDTAPTGHTLRLLELPVDWSNQIAIKSGNANSIVDHTAKEKFDHVIKRLQDPEQTTFCFVVYPENTPVVEAYRAVKDLEKINIVTKVVIANLVLPVDNCTNEYFIKRRQMQEFHLRKMEEMFSGTILRMPMMEEEIKGMENMVKAGEILLGT